ncbi:MAG: bifunctional [glutamate--ammonia ligase]-adenylyl-L-tyrosine phosphorylase/[glutamate--ammonia-ligase] adenylyltransferase [Gammaproteobacteria bacterium]|nr:bifunctional [glutamate--ammonia ligase]-adenylyl-L-tyrosine phosphorylase/[glutamate--ammonia-ligase] adenylyltransferase [Rhodocyclaceae bacterium]MBU3910313.1 bifunctional [glutamate--ammonia ligase]-adenylyl-L-tyrosine phosphorylase/[glutamate--ammonia-ligase] adenylyltransferase [Gammaproteobacteria bacterium]MBU3990243.1 bifunctional [glutamate--ammonia ligase]-adenylyl-L-tyrosine phosphorylase/[glutamate--ammonia-ligase] adenylyltransferase [Gammaproteobacteria bacterium]MBU4004140.1 b
MTAPTLLQTIPVDYSRYLARLVQARPEMAAAIDAALSVDARALDAAALKRWLDETPLNEDTLKPALRRLRQRAMAHIASRDLAGLADLAEVVESMTLLAETVVTAALTVTEASLVTRYGIPQNPTGERQPLIVIGMGKLGGRELNVSSDIDLIFVYPEDGDTAGNNEGSRSISNFEFFSRVGKGLINALADITGDGQVFRVDMRLRPNGDSGPLVCSFDMLENYFITQGREWERYAWIKARPIALSNTSEHCTELDNIRQHFVFRKYLDFGAINAMRDLHVQIRREVARKDMTNNVKLGPGGIREIEFIAQVFQLIRGGRDRTLQIKPTLEVLKLLVDRDQLDLDAVVELSSAYRFLRRLEHRLQYLDDAQTHALPENPDDQARVAQAMGFGNYEALLMELDDHRQTVSSHFEAIFADPNETDHALDPVWSDADGHGTELAQLGFHDTAALCARLAALRNGSRYRLMSEKTRTLFDTLVPRAIQAAAAAPNPDETLSRMLDLLEAISRRAAYLALLLQYPQALGQVARIASASSWAADYLLNHPVLLDELLDLRLLQMPPDWPAFRQQLTEQTDALEPDTEQQMDALREAHHAQVFRLVSQDVAELLRLEKLSDHLSELADIMVDRTITLAWRKLLKRHRETPAFAVISYGKLGGKELGYASDLDLVYLFDDPAPEAAEIYAKLGTRINTWLSSRTAAGILFETDLRLRPNGDAGLVVSSLAAFRKYQLESAWIWEHQALTRARFTAGDPMIGAAFEKIRCEVLRQRRDRAKLREEVLAMRRKMSDNLASRGDAEAFDLKHDPGGLVDVEFIVQYLILAYACDHPQLTGNLGNIALLRIAAECGLVPAQLAEEVRDAYREYRRLQHLQRLNNLASRVEAAQLTNYAAAVRALWEHVFAA